MLTVPTSTTNWAPITLQRKALRLVLGGMMLRSKKANDIRPNLGHIMEKNSHRYTHFTVYMTRSGSSWRTERCCPKPHFAEIVRKMLFPNPSN
jgi:hypothetical protein